jgi:hypothetical protein
MGRDRVHPELWVRSLFARLPEGGWYPTSASPMKPARSAAVAVS